MTTSTQTDYLFRIDDHVTVPVESADLWTGLVVARRATDHCGSCVSDGFMTCPGPFYSVRLIDPSSGYPAQTLIYAEHELGFATGRPDITSCLQCGHPLWAPTSIETGQCTACRLVEANAPKPKCGKTEQQHFEEWKSWRDNCLAAETGCGYSMCDTDQCRRGHPDDGVVSCGACGHGLNWPGSPGAAPCTTCGLPTWRDPGAENATCTNPNCP